MAYNRILAALDRYSIGRLQSIDFLRGIAATMVVLYHASLYGAYDKISNPVFVALQTVLHQGYLGVPLFFVISGFCIHAKAAKQLSRGQEINVEFVSFWKRRLFRLYPTYVVVLCLSMLLVAVAYMLGKSAALVEIYPEPKPVWMLFDFGAHLTMLHGFHPIFDQGGGNPPLWTLAREEYLYLMYFPLLYLRRNIGMIKAALVIGITGVLAYLAGYVLITPESAFWSIFASSALILWIQWVMGAVSVEVYYGTVKLPKLRWAYCIWAIPVMFALSKISEFHMQSLTPVLWALTFFLLVVACTQLEKINRWPQNRFFVFFSRVGVFSYSLYVIHNPVVGVTKRLLGPLANTLNPLFYLANTLIITMVCFTAALMLFQLVERRFISSPQISTPND